MPFCPACRFEYESHKMKCPDCNQDLVEHLADLVEDHGPEGEDFVALPEVNNRMEAEMVMGALESEGVISFAKTSGLVAGTFGVVGNSPVMQPVKVYVPASVREQCLEIQNCLLNACRPAGEAPNTETE